MYAVFKVQSKAYSLNLTANISQAYGLKWTRTTDLTLIRRAL